MRKLRFHEQKLLKKTNLIDWDPRSVKELKYIKKYHLTREEFTRYNKLINQIKQLVEQIKNLDEDEFRIQASNQLTNKLYSIGLIESKRLKTISRINAGTLAKRRLPVFIVNSKMFYGPLSTAVKYVEHGHVRVGPKVVRDPAFIVTRDVEDHVTWTDKFKNKISEYNGEKDDYED